MYKRKRLTRRPRPRRHVDLGPESRSHASERPHRGHRRSRLGLLLLLLYSVSGLGVVGSVRRMRLVLRRSGSGLVRLLPVSSESGVVADVDAVMGFPARVSERSESK